MDDAQKRRRLLLEMDDWTGARAQKPLAMTFPSANPDTPAWGWGGQAETEAELGIDNNSHYRTEPRPESASYSVKSLKGAKKDSPRYSYPSFSSTMYGRSSRPSLTTPFTSNAPKSSLSSQPVSGTLSTEERERFESEGVGILSPLGAMPIAPQVLDMPYVSKALRTPVTLLENGVEELEFAGSQASSVGPVSRESSMDREQTPSDIPEDLLLGLGSASGDCSGEEEEAPEKSEALEEAIEESAEESEAEASGGDVGDGVEEEEEQPTQAAESSTNSEMGDEGEEESDKTSAVSAERDSPVEASQLSQPQSLEDCDDDAVLLVPLSQHEILQEQAHESPPQSPSPPRQPLRQRTRRARATGSRPAPTLVNETSNLSEASRAAALFEAQRVTIRDIPDCNVSEDPIEDSESELEMVRRARSAQTRGGREGRGRGRGRGQGRGRGARGSRRANPRRQGW